MWGDDGGMTKNIWFVSGAGRGMGSDIAKAIPAAGYRLVPTGEIPSESPKRVENPRLSWSSP
jgi:hypothetical protein